MKKEFNPLTQELFKMAEECNKDYGVQPKLGLGNMWANVNPTYSVITKHIRILTHYGQVYIILKCQKTLVNYF